MKNKNEKLDLKLEAMGGLAAGIIGTVIGYPLDLVKTRMQTAKTTDRASEGMIRLGARIARQEGIASLYKGMVPPLISLSILNTINFASYNFIRSHNLIQAKRGWDIRNGIAGMMGAPIGSTISTVEHMLKTTMQLDNISEKRYRGSMHCLKTLVQERGWRALYTGHGVNTTREGLFLGTYFYTYEGVRFSLQNTFGRYTDGPIISKLAIPLAGGVSGAWAWFVSFPLDCIKAVIQGQIPPKLTVAGGNIISTLGPSDALRTLVKTKGWLGLYAGVTPSIARAFLVSSSRFSAYELVVWLGGDCR